MKRFFLPAFFVFVCLNNVFAFGYRAPAGKDGFGLKNAFLKGQKTIHAGAGFISLQYPSHDEYLIYGKVTSEYNLPINVRFDYGLTRNISAGVFLNMFKARTEVDDRTNVRNSNGFDYKSTTIGIKGAYHAYMGKNLLWLDPYVQGMLGMHLLSAKEFGENNYLEPQKGGFAYAFEVGANIYLFQPLGFYVEAGYGVNIFNTGIILRF